MYYAGMEMAFKRQCAKVAYSVIYVTNQTGMKLVPNKLLKYGAGGWQNNIVELTKE